MNWLFYICGGLFTIGCYTVAWVKIMPTTSDNEEQKSNGVVYLIGLTGWIFIWVWVCWKFI